MPRPVDLSRKTDYTLKSEELQTAILELLGRRRNAMTETAICRWFYGTPRPIISVELVLMCGRDLLDARATSLSRRRRVLEYSPKGAGVAV